MLPERASSTLGRTNEKQWLVIKRREAEAANIKSPVSPRVRRSTSCTNGSVLSTECATVRFT